MKPSQARCLKCDKLINVNQMVPQGHLMLLLGLIEVTVDHLKDGVFCINFSIMVLLVDLNLFFELLCLCYTHNLTPMREDLHSIKVGHLLLLVHGILEIITSQLHLLLLYVKILDAPVLMSDFDESTLLISG
jgi:hypothetical protein